LVVRFFVARFLVARFFAVLFAMALRTSIQCRSRRSNCRAGARAVACSGKLYSYRGLTVNTLSRSCALA
jgi:hypothetical protein